MSPSGVRLQKFISQAGLTSRRKAEEWIKAGRVQVNDRVVTEMGVVIDPSVDVVKVDGRIVEYQPVRRYIALHKPRFCVTTVYDPQGRPTVMDYVASVRERIYPVGRLDFDAEGLLLLTNDGELAHRLIHPSFGVKKEYLVLVEGHPGKWFFQKWREGVYLEEGKTSPAEVWVVKRERQGTWIRVVLHQGWYRQIKRMGQVTGHQVLRIKRIAYGPITLGNLRPGEFRELTQEEIKKLRFLTGLNREEGS